MEDHDLVALAAVAAMAVAHMVPPRLRFLRLTPRSRILSAAGGVSVAYVFVHLLPEVAEAQRAVEEARIPPLGAVDRHAYLVALTGLAVFYGLERAALSSRRRADDGAADTAPGAFWVSVLSFAVYNAIIGYLVVGRAAQDSGRDLSLFAAALGLHFVVNDLGLRHHHRRRYDRFGRPILVAALAAGWLTGTSVELDEGAVGLAVAFVAGGVVLNVLKEELPDERASRFGAFASGAAAYAALLLLT